MSETSGLPSHEALPHRSVPGLFWRAELASRVSTHASSSPWLRVSRLERLYCVKSLGSSCRAGQPAWLIWRRRTVRRASLVSTFLQPARPRLSGLGSESDQESHGQDFCLEDYAR